MIGAKTAINDNPRLNAREWPGKDPCRIIIDKENELTDNLNVLDGTIPTMVFTSKQLKSVENIEYIKIDFWVS